MCLFVLVDSFSVCFNALRVRCRCSCRFRCVFVLVGVAVCSVHAFRFGSVCVYVYVWFVVFCCFVVSCWCCVDSVCVALFRLCCCVFACAELVCGVVRFCCCVVCVVL